MGTTTATTTATLSTKRRKIANSKSKSPKKKPPVVIEPIAPKWEIKCNEYKQILLEKFELLQAQHSQMQIENQSLFKSESMQAELITLRQQLKEQNFNLDAHIACISKLCYLRSDGLSALVDAIKAILIDNDESLRAIVNALNVREVILKSSERKMFGIKPMTKNINKNEEMFIDDSVREWDAQRIYAWECLNISNVPKQHQFDFKECKHLNGTMAKYGTFCKKFHVLLTKKITKSQEKNDILQKIDDSLLSWSSKQKEIEKQRLVKEEIARKKREAREQQMREKKAKKEEMEKIKRQKAEQRQKEKEEKLKKEEEKKQQKLLEKQEKEKLQKQKSPNVVKKKRKKSFMDKWVKVTKFVDSTDANATPIITDKTISISSSNDSKSVSLPDPSLPLYEQIFHSAKYSKHTQVAPILPSNETNKCLLQLVDDKLICIDANEAHLQCPPPTAIPSVIVDGNEMQCKSLDLVANIVDLTMQIDDAQPMEAANDLMSESQQPNDIKLQYKFRSFFEDHRPSFFGVNKLKNATNIRKLCRKPFSKLVTHIDYECDDSGAEWYGDIDDLDNMLDDDEDASDDDLRSDNLRSDGFENDKFIINSDDDDEDALGDREAMKNMEKQKKLAAKCRGEYPIQHGRERGDAEDKTIRVVLPSIVQMKNESNSVLHSLTMKKSCVFVQELSHILHDDEKENDMANLIAIETRNDVKHEKSCKSETQAAKEKKKRKKEKKKKKKRKREKEALAAAAAQSGKMEMDVDEDDDIKMDGDEEEDDDDASDDGGDEEKSKLEEKVTTPVKNRLTNYFMVATKPKPDTNSNSKTNQEITKVVESNDANTNRKRERDEMNDNQQNDAEMKAVDEPDKATVNGQGKEEETKLKEPKKKKRRVVMCELID